MFLKEWLLLLIAYFYRKIIKPIIYLITKTHEIDRIINSKTNTEYSKYISLSIFILL